MKTYQIIKGTTYGKLIPHDKVVGYDWETGEEEFETYYETTCGPHEDIISEYDDYNEAREAFEKMCTEFEKAHRWPWNDPHFESIGTGWKAEYTDNDDAVWFIIKEKEDL